MYLPVKLRAWLVRNKVLRPRDLRTVALDYVRKHPEVRKQIIDAGVRAAEKNLTWDGQCHTGLEKPHKFSNGGPWGKCCRCGKTREEAGPGHSECEKWQSPADIEAILRSEEEKFEKVFLRAEKTLSKTHPYTGEELFHLHQTYGISPDVVEMIQLRTLPREVWTAFDQARETAAAETRSKQKPKSVIIAK